MRYRTIPAAGIRISEIGLGTWALGGLTWERGRVSSGWAPAIQADVNEAVACAVHHGVNHFDTADVYGNGHAERMLATALGARSRDVVIASKVGWFAGTASHAYEPGHISHQCEQSLRNLRRECIDIYYFHRPCFGDDERYLDDAVARMERLREQGKIRCIGLSAYTQRQFMRLVPRIRPAVIQCRANALDYRLIVPGSPLMTLCARMDIASICFSPLAEGLLLGKYRSATPPVFEPGDHRGDCRFFGREYLARVEAALDEAGETFGRTPEARARMALQFILAHQVVTGVIPGFRSMRQVKTLLAAADRPLNGWEMGVVRKIFKSV